MKELMPVCPLPTFTVRKNSAASLRLFVAALHLKAAGEPYDLHDGGVHHRHGLPYGAVQPVLAAAQRHIAVESMPKGWRLADLSCADGGDFAGLLRGK
jgi:hypothetical protein